MGKKPEADDASGGRTMYWEATGRYICFIGLYCFLTLNVHDTHAKFIYPISDSQGVGRRYDGIGGLSGGSGTSKLLRAYPEKQRNEILDYLFKPNFAASMQVLKVEIGGDSISADATEASHMHYSWDENYDRGYEWWMMKEAKKRNPNITLYGLPWNFPGWLGNGTQNPYYDPVQLATYIMKWVKGARDHHDLTIDYVGIWNERPYNTTYIKVLRKVLDQGGFSHTRIVAADIEWGIEKDILKDSDLAEAVDIIGVHYPHAFGPLPVGALQTGKTLWAAEDYSAPDDTQGGMLWGKILNENYVDLFMTSTIAWNLIDSYYEGLHWDRDSLMTARQPWSGHYIVESPIWMTAHRTQFTEKGWHFLRHGSGAGHLDFDLGTYMSLVSPDQKHLTIVIETITTTGSNMSKCKGQLCAGTPVNFVLGGSLAGIQQLYVWYSKFSTEEPIYFKQLTPLKVTDGNISFSINLDEVYTLTTLQTGQKGDYGNPPSSQPFPLPYMEDFENYTEHAEALLLAQQNGAFEVISVGAPRGNIMRQMVIELPVVWKGCKTGIVNYQSTMNLVGSSQWSDIYIETEARIGKENGTDGIYLGSRMNDTGCSYFSSHGVFFFIYPVKNSYIVSSDFGRNLTLDSGNLFLENPYDWMKISLLVEGSKATGLVNDKVIFAVTVPTVPTHGFVAVGTSIFGIADFDNLKVARNMADAAKLQNRPTERGSNIKVSTARDNTLYYNPGAH